MRPLAHITASMVIATVLVCVTKSAAVAGAAFLSGFLIDCDHLLEYLREYGVRGNAQEFFRVFHETRFKKLILVFHAWELVVVLLLIAAGTSWNRVVLGVAIGVFHHLVLDQLYNGFTPGGYFFVYRVVKKFSMREILFDEVVQQKRNQVQV